MSYADLSSPGQGVVPHIVVLELAPHGSLKRASPEGAGGSQDMNTSAPCVTSPGCVPCVEGVCPVKVTVTLGQ